MRDIRHRIYVGCPVLMDNSFIIYNILHDMEFIPILRNFCTEKNFKLCWLAFRVVEDENDRIDVYTKHLVDGYETELNLLEESSGTRKLFGLMPFIAGCLLTGTVLVIDELDAKIHPVLLRHIIMMFNDMSINKKKAQLIFTSQFFFTYLSAIPITRIVSA